MSRSLRIGFLPPDLGIGGAQRLVVDAAVELQSRGHDVRVLTPYHDPQRCFAETRDGTLAVEVHPPRLPFARKPRAVMSILRMAALARIASAQRPGFDVFFCDLVAHAIPILRQVSDAKILFYCHYPDCLLVPENGHVLYRFYRHGVKRLEEFGTGSAHKILVNSRYTESRFRETFRRLEHVPVEVLYPGVSRAPARESVGLARDQMFLLSLNRFDPAKNLELAIASFAALRGLLPASTYARVRLVIAGGYDERLPEQTETIKRLQHRADELGVAAQVDFRRSISDEERRELLQTCLCLVYTPPEEHFGLAPIEAMLAGRPVVAVDAGGVRETIVDGVTGFLEAATVPAFAAAIATLVRNPDRADRMGRAGRLHAAANFSLSRFGARLDEIVRELAADRRLG